MSTVRNRMIDAMKVRRFSVRTQQCYLSAIRALARYYNLPPDQNRVGRDAGLSAASHRARNGVEHLKRSRLGISLPARGGSGT